MKDQLLWDPNEFEHSKGDNSDSDDDDYESDDQGTEYSGVTKASKRFAPTISSFDNVSFSKTLRL